MRLTSRPTPRLARIYLVLGLIATAVAVLLLLLGQLGPGVWLLLGFGGGCLLVGAAQSSSLKEDR